jgi:hypothetical protein
MPSYTFDHLQSSFENTLDKLLDDLLKKLQEQGITQGLTFSAENKKSILKELRDHLKEEHGINLTNDMLKNNPALQKTLALALTAVVASHMDPTFKFKLHLLFMDKDKVDKLELKKEIKRLLVLLNNQSPHPENDAMLDQLAEKIIAKLISTHKFSIAEDDENLKVLDKLMSEFLRNMFGGIDPRYTGEPAVPLARLVGNLAGLVDMGPGFSPTAMIDQNKRIGGPDYTGSIELTLEREIGSVGLVDFLVDEFRAAGLLYDTVKPHQRPPGSVGGS